MINQGTYGFTVTGTSGEVAVTDTANVVLTCEAGEFTLTASPDYELVPLVYNGTRYYTITAHSNSNFNGDITLTTNLSAATYTVTFTPTSIKAGQASTMTVTPVDNYWQAEDAMVITVTGTAMAQSASTFINIEIDTINANWELHAMRLDADCALYGMQRVKFVAFTEDLNLVGKNVHCAIGDTKWAIPTVTDFDVSIVLKEGNAEDMNGTIIGFNPGGCEYEFGKTWVGPPPPDPQPCGSMTVYGILSADGPGIIYDEWGFIIAFQGGC